MVIGVVLAVAGILWIEQGVEFGGTPVWEYTDSMLGLYLILGGMYILFGAVFFFAAVLLVRAALRVFVGGSARLWGSYREFLFALGLTLGLLALTALGWGVAANVVTPYESAEPGVVAATTLWTAVAAAILGCASFAALRTYFRLN